MDLFPVFARSPDTVLKHYLEKVSKSPGIDDVDIGGLDFLHNARQLGASMVLHRPHSILPGPAFSV